MQRENWEFETHRAPVRLRVMATDSASSGGGVLFDGTCAFCESAVKFVARRDPHAYFRFGASQSPEGAALLARYGVSREQTRSIVLIEDGRGYLRSTASLRIARRLRLPWRAAALCLAIPRPVARRRLPRGGGPSSSRRRHVERLRDPPARNPVPPHLGRGGRRASQASGPVTIRATTPITFSMSAAHPC